MTLRLSLVIDGDASGGVDLRKQAGGAETGILGFEGGDPSDRGRFEGEGLGIARGRVLDFATRAEGRPDEMAQGHVRRRSGGGRRRGAVAGEDQGHEQIAEGGFFAAKRRERGGGGK